MFLFSKNKIVSFALVISCLLFIAIFFIEKSKTILNMIPMIRGEIALKNDVVITMTKAKKPILVKKDDPFFDNQLRLSGSLKYVFSDIAESICKKGDVVVIVGAYFGYDSILLGNILSNNGKIYAFEPNYLIFSCLNKSIVLNDLENTVEIRNIAILDRDGKHDIEDYMSVLKNKNGTFSKPRIITVNCNTLDKELENEKRPVNIFLIDEPGTEFLVIKGASDIIKKSPKITIVACIDNDLSSKNSDIKLELNKLVDDGFTLYLVGDQGKKNQASVLDVIAAKKDTILMITKN